MTTLLTMLAAGLVQAASPAPIEADIAWISRGEYCEPETVLPLPEQGLLVSNVCGFGQPGNGFLTLLGADG